jgi:hypothetical protein
MSIDRRFVVSCDLAWYDKSAIKNKDKTIRPEIALNDLFSWLLTVPD